MKFNFKTKKAVRKILSIVLLCAVSLGAVFGAAAIGNALKSEVKDVYLTYQSGILNADGLPEDNKNSMYSNAFLCDGLSITPKFDSRVQYYVAFYDVTESFISRTELMTTATIFDIPTDAVYARVNITPKSTYTNEDGILTYFERIDLANDLSITTFKRQASYNKVSLSFNKDLVGKLPNTDQIIGSPVVYGWPTETLGITEEVTVVGYESVIVKSSNPGEYIRAIFVDGSDNYLCDDVSEFGQDGYKSFYIPDEAYKVIFVYANTGAYNAWLVS